MTRAGADKLVKRESTFPASVALLTGHTRAWKGEEVQRWARGTSLAQNGKGLRHVRTDPRWTVAVHEAGHAVISRALRVAIARVTIPDDEALGRCDGRGFPAWFHPDYEVDARHRRLSEQQIMVYVAGFEAERMFAGRQRRPEDHERDFLNAYRFAEWCSGDDEEAAALVVLMRCRVRNLLRHPLWRAGLERLARELLERPTLTGKQAYAAIQAGVDSVLAPRLSRLRLSPSDGAANQREEGTPFLTV
jgi:hypothetical protein